MGIRYEVQRWSVVQSLCRLLVDSSCGTVTDFLRSPRLHLLVGVRGLALFLLRVALLSAAIDTATPSGAARTKCLPCYDFNCVPGCASRDFSVCWIDDAPTKAAP